MLLSNQEGYELVAVSAGPVTDLIEYTAADSSTKWDWGNEVCILVRFITHPEVTKSIWSLK